MELLNVLEKVTGIETYTAANSVLILANRMLEDYTKVEIVETESNREETGVDDFYFKPIKLPKRYTITIQFLPDSQDGAFIRELDNYIRENEGYFQLLVSNNSKFAGTWNLYIKQVSGIDIDVEPENEVFIFGGTKVSQLKGLTIGAQSISSSQMDVGQ